MISNYKKFLIVMMFVLLPGCAVGPDYIVPDVEMPSNWKASIDETDISDQRDIDSWWKLLDDPVLENLIARAGQENLDLKEAYSRIIESRARIKYAQGAYLPRIDSVGSYTRGRDSDNGAAYKDSGIKPDTENLFSTGFETSWEMDMFGRIRRSVESAQASFEGSVDYYNYMMVLLYSEVASTYVSLLTIQERIKYAQENIELQQETLKLTQARFKSELVPELDVEQAKLNLATTEATIFALKKRRVEAVNRLAVLLGEFPSKLSAELKDVAPIPDISAKIPKVFPAELIKQRPDIRVAERNLAAQTARIGVAAADLFPKSTFSGYFYLEGRDLDDMNDFSSRKYAFGPRFDWVIFDGNRIRNNIKIEKAKTEQMCLAYKKTILTAAEEVENALSSFTYEKSLHEALTRSTQSSKKSVDLVRSLYKSGLTDFQNVLDMQRTLFVQQDELANSKGQIIQEWIRIYKSFGGGWVAEEGQE